MTHHSSLMTPDAILFDHHARSLYLSGFHSRKLARAEAARSRAQQRQKQQRLHDRQQRRRALREQAAENARQVQQFYGLADHEEEEWTGIAARIQQYQDDHVLATVTVVQDFDPDTIRHGPLPQPRAKLPAPSLA